MTIRRKSRIRRKKVEEYQKEEGTRVSEGGRYKSIRRRKVQEYQKEEG